MIPSQRTLLLCYINTTTMDWKTLIFGSIAILTQHYAVEYRKDDLARTFPLNSTNYSLPHVETYDFIIVGGGASGCVLANRLSVNPKVKVLLVEAGGNPPPQTEIPAFAPETRNAPEIIYDYNSVPQKYANNKVQKVKVGRVLGGTSTINLMMFNRGHPLDYLRWSKISNDSSWEYPQLLQYFKSIENYKGEFPVTDQHGIGGPMTVSKQAFAPGRAEWFAAGKEKGFQIRDSNGPQSISFGPIEYNIRNGRRHSSYSAFLKPIEKSRPNLKVERYSQATKILIDENNNNQAYGLTYKKHGVYRGAYANKEIIITAGTFGTTQLLMKSGIGPAEILEKANITTIVDLPVGNNLQDHPKIALKILVKDKSIMFDDNDNTELNQATVDDFELHGKGRLSSVLGLSGQAFKPSSLAVADGHPEWPDFHATLYGLNLYTLLPDSYENETAIYTYTYLARPKSRGTVRINTENVEGPPLIDYNYFADSRDIQILTDAIKFNLEIFETTKPYKRTGAYYSTKSVPECTHLPFRSDIYWDCYLRNLVITGNHPCCTASMSRSQYEPNAVVDSKLSVFGVKGLRVSDASIMPYITNSNLQAVVYTIAEKTSAEIKKFWGI